MPSVLVRYDVENWAFHRRALGLQRYRRPGDQVTIASDYAYGMGVADGEYDAVLLCDMTSSFPGSRPHCRAGRIVRLVGSHGWLYPEYDPDDWRTKGVNGRNSNQAASIVEDCDTVVVYSAEQKRFFDSIHSDVRLMPYSIDTNVFRPRRITAEFEKCVRRLRVGWCGQLGGGEGSFKGFVEVMVPVIARLGEQFEWSINHRDFRTALSGPDLAKWYQSLDVFLCTSVAEGGPQTVFEAAACGCVPLSTAVGQVADWRWMRDKSLTTPPPANAEDAARVVGWFVESLRYMDANRQMRDRWSQDAVRAVRRDYDAAELVPQHLAIITGPACSLATHFSA